MVEGGISSHNDLLFLASLTASTRTFRVEGLKPNTTYGFAVRGYVGPIGFTGVSLPPDIATPAADSHALSKFITNLIL